jgi:hypothetical protein
MGTSAATVTIESLFYTPLVDTDDPKKEAARPDPVQCGISRRARDEARCLFRLVGQQGQTVRSVREQICIPPDAAREMFAFVEEYPDDGRWMLAAIEFRNRVLREFDALAQRAEYAEQIAAAEAESARRAAAEIVPPLLHELVVQVNSRHAQPVWGNQAKS